VTANDQSQPEKIDQPISSAQRIQSTQFLQFLPFWNSKNCSFAAASKAIINLLDMTLSRISGACRLPADEETGIPRLRHFVTVANPI